MTSRPPHHVRAERAGRRPHAAGGRTTAAHPAGYGTGDHRGRSQAPGRTHTLAPDDTLIVTTPSGPTAVTEPRPTDQRSEGGGRGGGQTAT